MMISLGRRIGLISLILVTAAIMFGLAPVDRQWTMVLHEHENRALVEFMGRTVFEGDTPGANDPIILYLLCAAVAYYLGWRRPEIKSTLAWRPQTGFMLSSALIGGIYLTHGLKWMVGRARPGLVVGYDWPFTHWFEFGPHFVTEGIYRGAFPSGHTAQAFFLMAIAYALAGDPTQRRHLRIAGWLIGIAAVVFSLTMGIARCMSLNHWLTDVVGAMLFGWILMHWLYFDILRVPAQRQYLALHGRLPDMPRIWELILAAYCFVMTTGIMMIVIGGRSISVLQISWMLLLVPVGMLISWMALKRISHLLNLLNTRLNASAR